MFFRYPRGFSVPIGYRLVLPTETIYLAGSPIYPYDLSGNLDPKFSIIQRYGDRRDPE